MAKNHYMREACNQYQSHSRCHRGPSDLLCRGPWVFSTKDLHKCSGSLPTASTEENPVWIPGIFATEVTTNHNYCRPPERGHCCSATLGPGLTLKTLCTHWTLTRQGPLVSFSLKYPDNSVSCLLPEFLDARNQHKMEEIDYLMPMTM